LRQVRQQRRRAAGGQHGLRGGADEKELQVLRQQWQEERIKSGPSARRGNTGNSLKAANQAANQEEALASVFFRAGFYTLSSIFQLYGELAVPCTKCWQCQLLNRMTSQQAAHAKLDPLDPLCVTLYKLFSNALGSTEKIIHST
jgi:hypothetical protein